MFNKLHLRKLLALVLCLAILTGMALLPALAAPGEEGGDPPAEAPVEKVEAPAGKEEAPAEKEEAPAEKEETPAEKEETPAGKEETPAEKEETPAEEEDAPAEKEDAPAEKKETPAEKEETPTEKEDAPAEKEETPTEKEDAPAEQEEAPAEKEEAPAEKEEAPAEKEDAPAEKEDAPAKKTEAPAAEKAPVETEEAPAALLADEDETAGDEGDGFSVDWDAVGTQSGGDWQVSEWGIARGNGGYYVYLSNDQGQASIGITYYHNASDAIRWREWIGGGASLLGENERPIRDSQLTVVHEGGDYRMEGFIPDSFFKESSFILSSGSVTLHSEDIPRLADATDMDLSDDVYNESHKEAEESTKAGDIGAAYTGIVIDGDMSDWDAVPRYDIDDSLDINGYPKQGNTVDQVSVVWDGEYVYILLVAQGTAGQDWQGNTVYYGNWNSVCGAGPNGNGQFAIVTDLNQQLLVQPAVDNNNQPTINGIDDAQVAVNSKEWGGAPHMWEIAIPAQRLPKHLENFDFGLYLMEPTISGITDLRGGEDGDKSFNGVVIDGKFADWSYYPMTTIQYATPGTQDVVRDAHGALWGDGKTLYGYVASNMISHLGAHGGEFLGDIALSFNGDRSPKGTPEDGNFYPRILAFDDLDRITPSDREYTADGGEFITLTPGYELADGDYTFYIFDTRTSPSAPQYDAQSNTTAYPTVEDMRQQALGTIKIHVDGVLDQAEFALDLEKVADYIGQDADSAFKVVEIQWGRLGQQWIAYAGTSTGPILGVALLVGAVGAPLCCSTAKKRRQAKAGGSAEK